MKAIQKNVVCQNVPMRPVAPRQRHPQEVVERFFVQSQHTRSKCRTISVGRGYLGKNTCYLQSMNLGSSQSACVNVSDKNNVRKTTNNLPADVPADVTE